VPNNFYITTATGTAEFILSPSAASINPQPIELPEVQPCLHRVTTSAFPHRTRFL
jgi:hypothetical protein